MGVRVLTGDCRETLRALPDNSVQCVVTSPPYWGLRDYGHEGQLGLEATPQEYVERMVAVFREVRRVLRDDGTLWLNLGDSYANHHSGAGLKSKDLVGIPWRVAFALQADGWWLRQEIIWHKPNPMPESVRDRCTKAHESVFLLTKSERYYFDSDAIKEPAEAERPAGNGFTGRQGDSERTPQSGGAGTEQPWRGAFRNKRSVWTIASQPYNGAHFAVMPPDLVEPCVLAGSREGDTVLDPFGGSGTVGMVARWLGRDAVLCELNPEYVALIEERVRTPRIPTSKAANDDARQIVLFAEVK